MKDIEYEFLADYFPKQEITLVHGTYGSGKSYSTIKCLNSAGIKPVYINLDRTAGLSDLDYYNIDGKILGVMDQIKDFDENTILIIDTYTMFNISVIENTGAEPTHIVAYKILEKIRESFNGTLIVIGHTSDIVTKDGLFKDNPILARNAAEVLWLEKAEYKATSKYAARIEYNLHINKGRGNGGARIVPKWMR